MSRLLALHLLALAGFVAARQCSLPEPGQPFESATPQDVLLSQDAVAEALAYANTHNRISVQIFRNNCRVGAGLLDPVTDDIPNNIWSSTKSVVSILTGMAMDRGLMEIDDPIDKYLPRGPSWGDAAHRAITIRDLLTETAGLDEAIGSEAATVGLDQSAPQEALAQKIKHQPGTFFEYTQRVPDLLLFCVERALNISDIQAFAQENLFTPIGIPQSSYFWLRDRSAHTYGYAWLFLPPTHLAKIGLLLQNGGTWNTHRILSPSYIASATASSPHNPCYGYLIWTNRGTTCTGANIPSAQTYPTRAVASAPDDLFATVGAFHQNNFVIPSLNMTVTWTGFLGDTAPNLSGLLSAAPADLYYNFFRILMRGVQDVDVPDPGAYQVPPLELDVNPVNYLSPEVLLADLKGTPGCNVLVCDGGVPTEGVIENLRSVARVIGGRR